MEGKMVEKKRKTYRNFTRSEKAIIRAYVELMQNSKKKKITVTDIVEAADLNRSTFYAHFKTSDEVLEKIHSDIIKEFMERMNTIDFKSSLSNPRIILKHVLEVLNKDTDIYRMLLNTKNAGVFIKKLEIILIKKLLADETVLPHIKDRDEFELCLRMIIGGFASVMQDWAAGEVDIQLERVIDIIGDFISNSTVTYTK